MVVRRARRSGTALRPGRLAAAAVAFAAAIACAWAHAAGGGSFLDVLDQPSQVSALASRALLQAVTPAGSRLVAVGQRGHILYSDDMGGSWKPARVPVSADLTAVTFPDAKHGWAVGHDGVILVSSDAGESWRVQMEARRFSGPKDDKSFLDVWFADARTGYAIGAYNLLMRTSDGGANWESWADRTDNPKQFNLHAIRPAGGALFIAGEAGLLLRLDETAQRFRAVDVPYKGSFFGVATAGPAVIVYGLRGNALATTDGARTWTKLETRLEGSIVAATRSTGGAFLLADASGRVVASDDGGRSFAPVVLRPALPIAGMTPVGRGLVAVVGPRGATVARVTPR